MSKIYQESLTVDATAKERVNNGAKTAEGVYAKAVARRVGEGSAEHADKSSAHPQLVLGFDTALLFWRAVHEDRMQRPTPTGYKRLPDHCATSLAQISRIDLTPLGIRMTDEGIVSQYSDALVNWGSTIGAGHTEPQMRPMPRGVGLYPGTIAPLHVMTSSRHERNAYRSVKTHLLTQGLPAGSLYRITDDILVVSCEMAFVQCCQGGRDLPHIELALELCGTYSLMTASLPCLFERKPVTSVERLTQFLSDCGRMPGVRGARNALTWISDMLASPRESEVYLYVTLPRKSGGFGIERPSVNVVVPVKGTRAENLTNEPFYRVDLIWEDKKVVLEYDGLEEHEKDPEKIAADKERRSVLAALGYTVIVMTKRDLKSKDDLRKKMAQLAYALGVRLPTFDQKEAKAHGALFGWLNNPLHDRMPFGCGYH